LNIIITGSAGFIGTHLTRHLLSHGYNVEGVDNYTHTITNMNRQVRHPFDIDVSKQGWENDKYIINFVENCDAIVHLAANTVIGITVKSPAQAIRNNVEGVLNVLEACRKHDLKMVFASSAEVYGSNQHTKPMNEHHPINPHTPYGASKIAGEYLCQTYRKVYGLKTNVTRCFNIYGPLQRIGSGVIPIFTSRVLNGKSPIVLGDGLNTRDYVYIDDIVQAYELAILKDFQGEPVNFCSGVETSTNDLADLIIKISGANVKRRNGPARGWEPRRSWGDFRRATREFNWKPEISLEEGLKKYVEWYKTHEIL